MTLTVGYLVAAFGPWILGAAHDLVGRLDGAARGAAGHHAAELVPGLPAARARTIAKNGA